MCHFILLSKAYLIVGLFPWLQNILSLIAVSTTVSNVSAMHGVTIFSNDIALSKVSYVHVCMVMQILICVFLDSSRSGSC